MPSAPDRLDVVFLSMMIPYHQGAITMAKLVPDPPLTRS